MGALHFMILRHHRRGGRGRGGGFGRERSGHRSAGTRLAERSMGATRRRHEAMRGQGRGWKSPSCLAPAANIIVPPRRRRRQPPPTPECDAWPHSDNRRGRAGAASSLFRSSIILHDGCFFSSVFNRLHSARRRDNSQITARRSAKDQREISRVSASKGDCFGRAGPKQTGFSTPSVSTCQYNHFRKYAGKRDAARRDGFSQGSNEGGSHAGAAGRVFGFAGHARFAARATLAMRTSDRQPTRGEP